MPRSSFSTPGALLKVVTGMHQSIRHSLGRIDVRESDTMCYAIIPKSEDELVTLVAQWTGLDRTHCATLALPKKVWVKQGIDPSLMHMWRHAIEVELQAHHSYQPKLEEVIYATAH